MGCATSADVRAHAAGGPHFLDKYTLDEPLGHGTYGEVCATRLRGVEACPLEPQLAVKVVLLAKEDIKCSQRMHRERDLWQKLGKHPNVVQLHACFFDLYQSDLCAFYVMERCSNSLIEKPAERDQLHNVFFDVLEAVEHVHGCGIVHRDIKLDNLLWSDSSVKLCDFGTAMELQVDGLLSSRTGTAPYMAPEMAAGQRYGFPVDI